MATKDPFFVRWSAKKFQATVINDIWPEMLFFTLVATMVTLVSEKTSTSLAMSNQMLTVLGIVLGLVVSFRTSSAYDRYWEGRKLWTNINLVSRNLAHLIWIHVPFDRVDKSKSKEEIDERLKESRLKAVIEKKSMINLVQAFSVAVKHALRGEAGVYYRDLYPLICFLPRYATESSKVDTNVDVLPLWEAGVFDVPRDVGEVKSVEKFSGQNRAPLRTMSAPDHHTEENHDDLEHTNPVDEKINAFDGKRRRRMDTTFDPERALPSIHSDVPLAPARNPPKDRIYNYIPLLLVFKPLVALWKRLYYRARHGDAQNDPETQQHDGRDYRGRKRKPNVLESSVPLEITLFISSYLAWLLQNGLLQPAIASQFSTALLSMQDTMANLDRIRTTPIPFAYQAHLRMSMWIYLFFLPFQMYSAFHYLTIPATAFASFLLLGFLEIGQEIEDPFNYDLNDLDLDHFCLVIQRELAEIVAHPCPDPQTFLFTSLNQPFAPADRRTAQEMVENVEHEYHGLHTGMTSMRRTLLRSWREVSYRTIHQKDTE